MKFKSLICIGLTFAGIFASCGNSKSAKDGLTTGLEDNSEEYANSEVNAIEQAKPEIMVLPSDGVLQRFGAANQTPDGVVRDYQKYLLADKNNKAIISAIQEQFVANNYPLNDLEQTLKQLATQSATDEADGLAKDAKTLLMETATPDIIVEVDYKTNFDRKTYNSTLNYVISFIDPYTNKVFATKSAENVDGDSFANAFKTSLSENMKGINKDLRNYFSGILTKGREISLRITVENGSNVNLQDESIEGDTYTDWIEDYLDTHAVKGSFKLKVNTKNELSFSVRIPTLNADGTQYSGYQWGRQLAKAMRKQLGVKVSNHTQGLANIHLVISGM
ncbi:MAG: hypothetical protein K2N05_12055 [Muribaculaceae bacterium]|nr:hypothetical protein [Muribaculaceae bacterium]